MLRIRPAAPKDFGFISRLYKERECNIEFLHIESAQIVEDEDGNLIALGVMNRILEATFLVEKNVSKRKRIEALKILMTKADIVAKRLTFTNYHVFSSSKEMTKLLLRKFKFTVTVSEVLLKWIGAGSE